MECRPRRRGWRCPRERAVVCEGERAVAAGEAGLWSLCIQSSLARLRGRTRGSLAADPNHVTLQLRSDLTGTGWAECTIELDGQRAHTTASYLSDALDELCRATLEVLRGGAHAEAVFEEEPGEYRWLLDRTGDRRVRIRIVDGVITPENPIDTIVVDGECTAREFGQALLSELQRLLELHGEKGYRDEWVLYPFPRSRLEDLRAVLELDV
jgi:hypothetical protein